MHKIAGIILCVSDRVFEVVVSCSFSWHNQLDTAKFTSQPLSCELCFTPSAPWCVAQATRKSLLCILEIASHACANILGNCIAGCMCNPMLHAVSAPG